MVPKERRPAGLSIEGRSKTAVSARFARLVDVLMKVRTIVGAFCGALAVVPLRVCVEAGRASKRRQDGAQVGAEPKLGERSTLAKRRAISLGRQPDFR